MKVHLTAEEQETILAFVIIFEDCWWKERMLECLMLKNTPKMLENKLNSINEEWAIPQAATTNINAPNWVRAKRVSEQDNFEMILFRTKDDVTSLTN